MAVNQVGKSPSNPTTAQRRTNWERLEMEEIKSRNLSFLKKDRGLRRRNCRQGAQKERKVKVTKPQLQSLSHTEPDSS